MPPGETVEELIQKLDRAVRLPGLTNSWGYPIRTRIDMLSTGIRTAVGIKITGPDLAGIAALAETLETTLKKIPGTRAVFGERVTGGRYLDIDIDRAQAARYGVTVAAVQRLIQSAIGGENIDTVVDGRERFSINLRYPRALRDSMETLAESRIATPSGIQVPLGTVARLRIADGQAEIKSENGRLTGYVYLYVEAARQAVDTQVKLPPGYAIAWSGQYANLQHARQKKLWLIPFTVLLVLLLLYLHFREPGKVVVVAVCLPFSLVGGFWLVYWLGYNLSVAVGVGFIALAGVAAEFGGVMLLYIDKAVEESRQLGCQSVDRVVLWLVVVLGALLRVWFLLLSVVVFVAGLLPVMFSVGAGSEAMKRIAAPLVGGMLTAPLLSLFVIPALYWSWKGRGAHSQTGND